MWHPVLYLSSLVKDVNSSNSMWYRTWVFCNHLTVTLYFQAVAQLIVMMNKHQLQFDLQDGQRITQHGKFCCFYLQKSHRITSLKLQHAKYVAQLVENSTAMQEGVGSIPGLGRSPGEEKGYLLQYSGLENSMDCIVPGIAKSRTWLSNFHSLTQIQLDIFWAHFLIIFIKI